MFDNVVAEGLVVIGLLVSFVAAVVIFIWKDSRRRD